MTVEIINVDDSDEDCEHEQLDDEHNPYVSPRFSPNRVYSIHYGISDYDHPDDSYRLLANDDELCSGKLTKPEEGRVADNGTFSLLSSPNDELSGQLHVFDNKCVGLFDFFFTANTGASGLSEMGKFAAVTTANSTTAHAQQLFFFNIESKKMLWHIHPTSGHWPMNINIDEKSRVITMVNSMHDFPHSLEYTYDFDGNFLDAEKLKSDTLAYGSSYSIYSIYKEEAEAHYDSGASKLPEFLDDLIKLTNHVDADEHIRAKINRLLGELYEANNNPASALECYEKALSLDSKVGVKRKVSKLQKIIAS